MRPSHTDHQLRLVTGVSQFDPDGPGGEAAYARQYLIQIPEPTAAAVLLAGGLLLRRRR